MSSHSQVQSLKLFRHIFVGTHNSTCTTLIFLSSYRLGQPLPPPPRVWNSGGLLKEHCPISGQLALLTLCVQTPSCEELCRPFSVSLAAWGWITTFQDVRQSLPLLPPSRANPLPDLESESSLQSNSLPKTTQLVK